MNRRELLASSTILGTFLVGEKDSKAEKITKNEQQYNECLKNVQKAKNILEIVGGYTPKESDEIRKAVAKHLPKAKEYKRQFYVKAWLHRPADWRLAMAPFPLLSSRCYAEIWCAIAVTFCSAGTIDGFAMLEIDNFLIRDISHVA